MSKVDHFLFMSKTAVFMLYVGYCLFWERSQSEIDNAVKYFKEYGNIYNWEHSKEESVSKFLGIDTKTLNDGGFQFY